MLHNTVPCASPPPKVANFDDASLWIRREADMDLRSLWDDRQKAALTPERDGWARPGAPEPPPGSVEVEAACLDRAGGTIALRATARNPALPPEPGVVPHAAFAVGVAPVALCVAAPGRVHVLCGAHRDGCQAASVRLRPRRAPHA